MPAVLDLAGRLRASRADLFEALQPEELSPAHRFVLGQTMAQIEALAARMQRFEQELLKGLSAWQTGMYSRGIPTLMLAKIRSVRSQSRGRAGMRIALQIIL